jgi:hypothetical protein
MKKDTEMNHKPFGEMDPDRREWFMTKFGLNEDEACQAMYVLILDAPININASEEALDEAWEAAKKDWDDGAHTGKRLGQLVLHYLNVAVEGPGHA